MRVGSRKLVHAEATCDKVSRRDARRRADAAGRPIRPTPALAAIDGAQVVIACGPPGVELLPTGALAQCRRAAGGDRPQRRAARGNRRHQARPTRPPSTAASICYGALGVGGTKMKIHKAAIARLFTANDLVLDADEIYALAKELH